MSFQAYDNAVARLANEELTGGDIEKDIATLAQAAGRDQSNVRHDVNEKIDLIKD